MSEFLPVDISRSIAHVGDVYHYAKGERVLPLQQKDLIDSYLDSIKKYFEYCNQALTDSSIVDLIARGRVGLNDSRVGRFNTQLGQTEGVRGISRNVSLLISETPPRLVFAQEAYWISNYPEEKLGWTEDVVNKYRSVEGHEDWVFAQTQVDGDARQACLYGFRTMDASDLFYPDMLPRFVNGISQTFTDLRVQAISETAKTFDGIRDVNRIKEITQAFSDANNILEKVFNPVAVSPSQPTPRRGRSPKTPQ